MSGMSNTRSIPSPPLPSSFTGQVGVAPRLPKVNYFLPVIVTLLAAVVVFLAVALITLAMLFNALAQWSRAGAVGSEGAGATAVLCGLFFFAGLVGTGYFFLAVLKGVRDLRSPLYYTRGSLANKRSNSGRMVGNWLGVAARYSGSDLVAASQVNDEQRAASVDRSQIVQTRFGPPMPRRQASYLPEDRISSPSRQAGSLSQATRRLSRDNQVQDIVSSFAQSLVPESAEDAQENVRLMVFRIDAQPHANLETGDEVLVAHSRFLQHIFYVARLKNGEWEAFPNKTLI